MKILVTGGGTSGHISPALALIQTLRELEPTAEFLYVGSQSGLEKRLVEAENIAFAAIATGKLRRYLSLENLVDQFRIPLGILQSLKIVRRFRPDVVLATGGYVAVPPVLAAFLLKVPILIHEQTAQIGLANRINARCATKIALSWESSLASLSPKFREKAWVSGNPVRPQIFGGEAQKAVEFLGLSDENLPVLYITGGSLGARKINLAVEEVLPALLEKCRVIHQCGEQRNEAEPDFERLQNAAAKLPENLKRRYALQTFIRDELKDVFALCDLVLGRAGAGTVAELCALGKPAIYVPLVPTGGDEQTKNARMAVEKGAAVVIRQDELSGEKLLETVEKLLAEPERLAQMGQNAQTLARPGAAREIADAAANIAQDVENNRPFAHSKRKIARVRRVEAGRIQAAITVVVAQFQHRIQTFGTLRLEVGHDENRVLEAG